VRTADSCDNHHVNSEVLNETFIPYLLHVDLLSSMNLAICRAGIQETMYDNSQTYKQGTTKKLHDISV